MLSMRKSQKRCSKKLKMKLKNTKISVTYQPDNTQRMKKKSANCSFLLQSVLLKIIAICKLSDQFECLKLYFEIWPRNNTLADCTWFAITQLWLLSSCFGCAKKCQDLDMFFKLFQESDMYKYKNKKTEQRKCILNCSFPSISEWKDRKSICYVNCQP